MFLLKHNILNTVEMITAKRMAIYRKTILVLLVSIVTGCASFPDYRIGKIDAITPSKEPISTKPSVYLPLKFMSNLSSGDKDSDVESTAPLPILKKIVEKTANESAIFQSLTFESFQAKNVDYILQIEMTNYGSKGKAVGAGLITGLTLFVVPTAATDNYKLLAKLYDKDGKLLKTYSYDDSISTWFGIWLLPVAWKTPKDAVQELWENMFRAMFRDLAKENILGPLGAIAAPPRIAPNG